MFKCTGKYKELLFTNNNLEFHLNKRDVRLPKSNTSSSKLNTYFLFRIYYVLANLSSKILLIILLKNTMSLKFNHLFENTISKRSIVHINERRCKH